MSLYAELYSGQSLPFIAKIEKSENGKVLCRWFWRINDLPEELKSSIVSDDGRELVLGSLSDWNDEGAVLRFVTIGKDADYFYRYIYEDGNLIEYQDQVNWSIGTIPLDPTRKGIVRKFENFFKQGVEEIGEIPEFIGNLNRIEGLAAFLENALFDVQSSYKAQCRSLIFNLSKNSDLRRKIVQGLFSVESLVTATPDELAGESLQEERRARHEKYLREQVMLTGSDNPIAADDVDSRGESDVSSEHEESAPLFSPPPKEQREERVPRKEVTSETSRVAEILRKKVEKLENSAMRDFLLNQIAHMRQGLQNI